MFRNYVKLAWRNLIRNRAFSFINIFGLSLGIAFVMLTGGFVWRELHVNDGLADGDRTYIILSKWKDPNMGLEFTTLAPLSKALKDEAPGLVEDYYHHDGITSIVAKGNKKFSEGLQVGDTSFVTMFGFPLLHGDPAHPFRGPFSLVMTAGKAMKYFGRTDVVGESLTLNSFSGGKQNFVVSAVMKDPPFNTVTCWGTGAKVDVNEFFLPAESLKFFGRDAGFVAWQNAFILSYVKLRKGVRPEQLQGTIDRLLKTHVAPDVQQNLKVQLASLDNYYLSSGNGSAKRLIYTLTAVTLFMLIMAIVNFINISIGHAVTRLKEIGVRKTMGGSRVQLILQFILESILLVAISTAIGMALYILFRPYFGSVLGVELPEFQNYPTYMLLVPFGLAIALGVLAGSYPAFVLSGQPAAGSLKGKLRTVGEKVHLRRAMIVVQFVTAIVVFVATIMVDRQVDYFLHKDLGYDREHVVTAKVPRDWTPQGFEHLATIRNEFSRLPAVKDVTLSYEIPDGASAGSNVIYRAGQDSTQGVISTSLFTDEKYLSTYDIPLVAGAFFNAKGGAPDPQGFVLNETAVKALGWKDAQAALGGQLRFQGGQGVFNVTGVVKDFHFGSKTQAIQPMFFVHLANNPVYRYISFRLKPGDVASSISAIQHAWDQHMPDAPFEYVFMDDVLARMYPLELEMRRASGAATVFSIVVVLLGIFGLVTLSVSRREKEMGVRKVLGASVTQVIGLFAREFAWLMLIANLVAWPLGWMLINKWTSQYAYRVELNLMPFFIVAACMALLVGLVILLRTWNLASESPAKRLRAE